MLEHVPVVLDDAFTRLGDADQQAASRAMAVRNVFADRVPPYVVTQRRSLFFRSRYKGANHGRVLPQDVCFVVETSPPLRIGG